VTVAHTRPRRLPPQQRREHLLDTAAAMFAEQPYDDVMIQNIAARAGVSRALMYTIFRPSETYTPRYSSAPVTGSSPASAPIRGHRSRNSLPPRSRATSNPLPITPFEAITINRGALSDDPAIRAIVAEQLNVVGQRLADQLVAEGHTRDATEIAVEAWLAFVRAACVK
jgi:hypothetical protein